MTLQKSFIWAISNVCCGDSNLELKKGALEIFFEAIKAFSTDESIVKDCLWAIRYLTKNDSFEWLEERGDFIFQHL
jgi:hypothetical protein